jgi:uncharacterized protein YjiK
MKKLLFLFLPLGLLAQETVQLKALQKFNLVIPEPSDICISPDQKTIYIVSDDGGLFECNTEGKVLRKYTKDLIDVEGAYCDDQFVWIVEERTRLIKKFDRLNLQLVSSVYVPYEGGRNKCFESITKDKNGNWLMITERDPVWMIRFNQDFKEISRIKIPTNSDVSAATRYQNKLYLLSDESAEIWEIEEASGAIITKYKIPVLNPEGLAIADNGNIYVLSDDGHQLIVFNFNSKR